MPLGTSLPPSNRQVRLPTQAKKWGWKAKAADAALREFGVAWGICVRLKYTLVSWGTHTLPFYAEHWIASDRFRGNGLASHKGRIRVFIGRVDLTLKNTGDTGDLQPELTLCARVGTTSFASSLAGPAMPEMSFRYFF